MERDRPRAPEASLVLNRAAHRRNSQGHSLIQFCMAWLKLKSVQSAVSQKTLMNLANAQKAKMADKVDADRAITD
jgi:hypothetical protein